MAMQTVEVHLTVTAPFENYIRGDHITDPTEIARVRRDYHHHVVQRIAAPQHVDGSFYGPAVTQPFPA